MTTDKSLILRRFGANFESYDRLAHVQKRICADLFARLDGHARAVENALEIGAGTGFLTRHLVSRWPRARWWINDLTPAAEPFITPVVAGIDAHFVWGDAEVVNYPAELDLIASASTVQWFADKAAFARRAAAALKSGGLLAVSLFGPENFRELRGTAGLEYLSLNEFTALLEASGFRILHTGEYTETLTFAAPRDVLQYIKSLGLNALGGASRGGIAGFDAVTLTYHPLIVIAERR